jgi:hypothetical protein
MLCAHLARWAPRLANSPCSCTLPCGLSCVVCAAHCTAKGQHPDGGEGAGGPGARNERQVQDAVCQGPGDSVVVARRSIMITLTRPTRPWHTHAHIPYAAMP